MVYDFRKVEEDVKKYWDKNRINEKLVDFNAQIKGGKKKYYLLDGPPYSNGHAHVGHVKTTACKDIWGRLALMKGLAGWFQPGFDCHGLPIENKVEKELKLKCKQDIESCVGPQKFIKTCQKLAEGNIDEWMSNYKRLGALRGNVSPPYLTYKDYYIESGWWTVKTLYEKGLIYIGQYPIFWCPHCETALSDYEASDEYRDVTDPSIFIKFRVVGKEKEYLLAWTTTPWTLPANVALVVHPDEEYVRVSVEGEVLIVAQKRLAEVVGKKKIKDYKVLEKFKGKKLKGVKYEPLLDIPLQKELSGGKLGVAHEVVLSIPIILKKIVSKVADKKGKASGEKTVVGHLVTMDSGTGIVHCAPGHGQEDHKIGEHYKLAVVSPVDESGNLSSEAGMFAGEFVKKADRKIVEHLDELNKLYYHEMKTHSYPLCSRCKTPLIYRLHEQWFLRINKIKDKMLKFNEKVNWHPEFGQKRFYNWLDGAKDFALTQQRYWGIPLPVWICEKCGEKKVVGSREEMNNLAVKPQSKDCNLHKDVVDKVKFKCSCGAEMTRHKDIMNVWFDSGIAPWASLGYPYCDNGLFKKLWPVDMITEAQDQIRGWFYSLMFMGVATFDVMPYKSVGLLGWTLDHKGDKMSKSIGNVVSAEDALDEVGADILRLYYCYDVGLWETQKFSLDSAKELNKMMSILENITNYIQMYDLDVSAYAKKVPSLNLEDRWMLSRLNSFVKEVREDYDTFRWHLCGRKFFDFIVNDFSRWYIKLVRERSGDKDDASEYVISKVLNVAIKLMAPITPYISEYLYVNNFSSVEKVESVHMCMLPEPDLKMIDRELELQMKIVDDLVEASNSLRVEHDVKLRWPLRKLSAIGDSNVRKAVKNMKDIIVKMCNVKDAVYEEKDFDMELAADFKKLGPVFGKDLQKAVVALKKVDAKKAAAELDKSGSFVSEGFKFNSDMVCVKKVLPSELDAKEIRCGAVYLDFDRDAEIIDEAFAREIIRAVQVARKEAGKDVKAKLELTLTGDSGFLSKWSDEICAGTNTKVVSCKKLSGKKKGVVEFGKKKVEFAF